jgi:hypothetical protein
MLNGFHSFGQNSFVNLVSMIICIGIRRLSVLVDVIGAYMPLKLMAK